MSTIPIPHEAFLAAEDAYCEAWNNGEDALRAAIQALLRAWPGMVRESDQLGGNWHRIILPLAEAKA